MDYSELAMVLSSTKMICSCKRNVLGSDEGGINVLGSDEAGIPNLAWGHLQNASFPLFGKT
jgi:hypothetical protein